MKFEITKEELDAVKKYKNEEYTSMNQLFCDDVELLLMEKNKRDYSEEAIVQDFDRIIKIYEAMVKNFYHSLTQKEDRVFYKGCDILQVEKLKNNSNIAPFLLLSTEQEIAQEEMENHQSKAVLLELKELSKIPYIQLEETIILAPFTKIVSLNEIEKEETWKTYELFLQEQKMEILNKKRKKELYQHILEHSSLVAEKIDVCQKLDEETEVHYENIRKLEQLMARHHFTMEQEKDRKSVV